MRIGFNPNKDRAEDDFKYNHQIIIPVYIPNFDGYFKDSLKILKICLESLKITSHDKTFFTIVNNGCCNEVKKYIDNLFVERKVHEVIHTKNIGKVNAVLKGVTGHKFKLVTIADADVLYLHGWQKETYKIFKAFPKAGVVCTTPSSKSLKNLTANIYIDNIFSKKIHFSNVMDINALKMFAKSINNPKFYNSIQLRKILTVNNKNNLAVIGAGHFAATYRCDVFHNLKMTYSEFKLSGNSERIYLDLPVIKKGYWRLSTLDNFTYHMGNIYEDWMGNELSKIKSLGGSNETNITLEKKIKYNKLSYFLKNILFKKIIFNKNVFKLILRGKGLTKTELNKYIN